MFAKTAPPTAGLSAQSKTSVTSVAGRPRDLSSDAVMQPWMTTELLEHTQRVWSPRYGYELSEEDAIEILTNTRRIAEALIRNLREDKTV
jgi:hypothetical protein